MATPTTPPTQSTRTDLAPAFNGSTRNIEKEKADCLAKGGQWDGNKCILPLGNNPITTKDKPPVTPPPANITTPEIIRQQNEDGSLGKQTGITLPNGRTFLGISPKEIEMLAGIEQKNATLPQGTVPAGTAQAKADVQAQNQQLQGSITGQPQLTEQDLLNAVPQEPGLEALQAGGAGLLGAATVGFSGALLGAKIGALGGTAVAPGAGTLLGGIAGAFVGLIGGAYVKISRDKQGDATQAKKVAAIAYKNFGQTSDALNAGLISRDEAIKRWQDDRISLYAAQANLKRETDRDLDRFLSGGADELATVNDYIRDLEDFKTREFLMALEQPNPMNVKYVYANGAAEE